MADVILSSNERAYRDALAAIRDRLQTRRKSHENAQRDNDFAYHTANNVLFDTNAGFASGTHETCEQRAPVERALARRVYLKSERDMSGYRVVIGFDTLTDVQAAHQEVADIPKAPTQKALEQRRGTPEEEADWAQFGDCPRCWRCAAPVITIPGCAPGCIRNCPPSPQSEPEQR